ncbi:50S ribosomal protein L10 [Polystyrenella longa]|uniref:Large ribosomal subunit protein uL10 n=1 Tax=Polystyrenella longa TaxID=2528007 RepID=A0A518CRA6_9PLAN|nr:50S ribosomal protein L10 [Polystyrenella longa]QDU81757.1 50S ribosomal protein L10 [Polystyrenella longa]
MSKRVKGMIIDEIQGRIDGHSDMLVVDVSRLDAITTNKWRLALQGKDIEALSVKNSLARVALERKGITGLGEVLNGSSTLIWGGEDIVALSKEIAKWGKELKELDILGGTVEGETLDTAGVEALSKSPSREEILSTISGLLLSPGAQISAALLGPGSALGSQIKSKSEEEE